MESVFKASNIFQVKILQLKSLSKFRWALFPLNEVLRGGSGVGHYPLPTTQLGWASSGSTWSEQVCRRFTTQMDISAR